MTTVERIDELALGIQALIQDPTTPRECHEKLAMAMFKLYQAKRQLGAGK